MTSSPTPRPEVVDANEFIVVYRALASVQCHAVIEQFDRDPGKWRGRVGGDEAGPRLEDEIKRSWDLEIRDEGPWQPVLRDIHPPILACFADYVSRSPVLQSFDLQATGYKVQMYPRGEGHFRWHADSVGRQARDRVAAMVLYLNDVAEGGETAFYHQGLKIRPRAGHLLMFPAGWNYLHCGEVPRSGDKYILQSFLKVRDTP